MHGKNIDLTGDNVTISSNNFNVNNNGDMTCNNANITGNIKATSGKIAGYTINGNQLIGSNVGMSGLAGEGWGFWAGSNNAETAPFKVGHNGTVYASNADITGNVNATSGSFTGSITATSGTFDNCTVRNNCSVAGNSISTSSSDRINDLYVSNLHGVAVEGEYIGTSNDYGVYSVGNYSGKTVNIPVPVSITVDSSGQVTAQTWKRLVFRGGILVEVQDNW